MITQSGHYLFFFGMKFFKNVTKKCNGKISWKILTFSIRVYFCLITRLISQVITTVCSNEPIKPNNRLIEQQIKDT